MPAPRPSGRMWVAAILLHFISLAGLSEAQRKVITVGGTLSFTGSLEGTAKGINQCEYLICVFAGQLTRLCLCFSLLHVEVEV